MDEPCGVSDLWKNVNHVAIVVSNIGCSVAFYSGVLGMKQVGPCLRSIRCQYSSFRSCDQTLIDMGLGLRLVMLIFILFMVR